MRYLFSMPFIGLIDAIADTLFPPNTVKSLKGADHTIVASDAMVHRYILFRATWQPDWGKDIHTALRLFSSVCDLHFGSIFPLLTEAQQKEALSMLEDRKYSDTDWNSKVDQRRAFNQIREGVAEGLFAEPGYGGNFNGLGWYYSNFMVIED
ncbi:gluconate 2-dehydrogenase subunit 3 family protein [Nitratireductor sp. XY-223]|uniref:gluconate 2-dehydrogenase subunit 3 family protein n=1 Tax=Nitratireductor sp. XY-223 TaxID=2561926 RepID=UPI00145A9FF1|nr:gluconate 2-dehydrogenase subunit 3 family protein [Nitratireductor sp. XY-223]